MDRELYTQQCVTVRKLICEAKGNYYAELISELESDPKELFGTLEVLLKGRTEKLYPHCSSTEELANRFADYLNIK